MARNISKAQAYSEKVFTRLMRELSSFMETEKDKNLVNEKLMKLNDKWVDHCRRTPEMTDEGKKHFLTIAGQLMSSMP